MRKLLFPVGVTWADLVWGTWDLWTGEKGDYGREWAAISIQPCFLAQVWAPRSSVGCVGTAAVGNIMASMPAMAAVASSRGV